MADKEGANVEQLRIVDGTRQEDALNLGIAEQRSFIRQSVRGKGRLYVLIELSGGLFGREELAQDLVTAVMEEYFQSPGTVTYGLRQAVLLANAHLLRANERVSSEHRVGGIACVVVRGREVFIAQAGWPMVYLIHRERVQAFPNTALEDQDTSMLGQRQTTEVRLFHSSVQSGDKILMLDGPMARQLGITRIGQVVSGSVERAVHNLETLAPPEDCTAMLIQMGALAQTKADQWAFTPVESPPAHDVSPSTELPSAPVAPPEQDVPVAFVEEPFEESFEEPEAPQPEPVPPASRSGAAIGEQAGTVFKAIGRGVRTLGERLLPDKGPPATPSQRRRRGTRARCGRGQAARQTNWWIAAAIAIPILVLIVAGGSMLYRNWSIQSQFESHLEAARLKGELALASAESPTVARDYWLEVVALVEDADALQPGSAEVLQLRAQAEAEIDRIDGVTRLGQIYKLYDYDVPGSAPSRIIVAGLDVYVLDRGAERVYHHALNDLRNAIRNPSADQVLIQEGQPVEGQNVGRLIDIAWMADGGERQAGALLILDVNGLLVEFDPSWERLRTVLVGDKDAWRAPMALRTYDSNLYLLDAMANQVFKYPRQDYTSAPSRWIRQSDADLSTAIDMGIDGNIYILHKDGAIAKYFGGEVVPFAITRIPKPLTSADTLYLDVEEITQYMYVADGTDRRIIQLDREGAFIRQLEPALEQQDLFTQLSGVFVDETGGKLYCVAANVLYVTDLPPVQR